MVRLPRFDDPQIQALVTWLGLAGTLIGILLAFILARRAARPRPAYRLYTASILQADDRLSKQGIAILYRDQTVRRLTKTTIVFWNAGSSALKAEDVRSEYPLGWSFPLPTSVLGVRVLATTREANHLEAYKSATDSNVVLCRFEYLNKNDGALIEVLHTGDKRPPKPVGEILNISPALTNLGPLPPSSATSDSQLRAYLYGFSLTTRFGTLRPFPPLVRRLRVLNVIFWRLVALAGGIFLLVYAADPGRIFYDSSCNPPPEGSTFEACRQSTLTFQWTSGIVGAVMLLFLLRSLLRRSRRYPSALDPRDVI
jgi:hypothetical protein